MRPLHPPHFGGTRGEDGQIFLRFPERVFALCSARKVHHTALAMPDNGDGAPAGPPEAALPRIPRGTIPRLTAAELQNDNHRIEINGRPVLVWQVRHLYARIPDVYHAPVDEVSAPAPSASGMCAMHALERLISLETLHNSVLSHSDSSTTWRGCFIRSLSRSRPCRNQVVLVELCVLGSWVDHRLFHFFSCSSVACTDATEQRKSRNRRAHKILTHR